VSNYIPLYVITNRMLELVSTISEKVGKITTHKERESRPHLRKNNRISSIKKPLPARKTGKQRLSSTP
jgi:hypothetical protein